MANFHEDFRRVMVPPSERSTGLVFAGVTLFIAALSYRTFAVWTSALGLSLGLMALSLFAPAVLKPLNLLWFRLSTMLYKVFNPLVMWVLYLVAIVPAGILMQLFRDPLQTRRQGNRNTYWLHASSDAKIGSMKNQF
jgi:hypothetical protein